MKHPTDLDAIQKLCDAATPGPWTDERGVVSTMAEAFDGRRFHTHVAEAQRHVDRAFIAAARTLVPQMAEEIRELRAELAAATEFTFRAPPPRQWLDVARAHGEPGGRWSVAKRNKHVQWFDTREEAIARARRIAGAEPKAGGEENRMSICATPTGKEACGSYTHRIDGVLSCLFCDRPVR